MAGDWLKVEKDTPEKPEILAMATDLGLDPEIVFAKCFKAWRWADSHTADGNAPCVTAVWLDALLHAPRFADALVKVGWLVVRNGSLQFPNFEQHMGQSGKRRALTARRQKKFRNAKPSRNSNADCVTREEKRRDKEKIRKESPPRFDEFWNLYPRRDRRREAEKAWKARISEGVSEETLIAAARRYADNCRHESREEKFVMLPTSFLSSNRRFEFWANVPSVEGSANFRPPPAVPGSTWHVKARKYICDMTNDEKNQFNVPVGAS